MWKKFFVNPRTFSTSVETTEINHFKQFSRDWWNEMGAFKPLHSMNKVRIPLIRKGISNTIKDRKISDISILEVGCGGGILAEPLARIGSHVTGIDPNADLIASARMRVKKKLNIEYLSTSIEEFAAEERNKERFDVVVASEVVEHLTDKEDFLKKCLQCLKQDGSIFVTTMNKTVAAAVFGIFVAEYIVNIIPQGTHHYEKFITPGDLGKILEEFGCKIMQTQGFMYNFLTNEWSNSDHALISYAVHAVKLSGLQF